MKKRLSIAAIWALSLVIVSGTTATAAVMITSKQIKNGSIMGIDLKNNTIPPAKLTPLVRNSISAAGSEIAGIGVVQVDASGATAAINTTKSYNGWGGTMTASKTGTGTYSVTVPGMAEFSAGTVIGSLSTDSATGHTVTASLAGSTVTIRSFSGAAPTDLPANSSVSFVIV